MHRNTLLKWILVLQVVSIWLGPLDHFDINRNTKN